MKHSYSKFNCLIECNNSYITIFKNNPKSSKSLLNIVNSTRENILLDTLINRVRIDDIDNLIKEYQDDESAIIKLLSFKQKDFWIKESDKTGRLYSTFANLNRELRKKVQIRSKNKKGNERWLNMGCVDLQCAQPYLLSYIANDAQ